MLYPDTMTPLGTFIRQRREAIGLNQRQAAAAWCLTQGLLSEIELGQVKNPRADTLIKIANGLGVTLDELLGQTGQTAQAPAAGAPPTKENGRSPRSAGGRVNRAPDGKRRGMAAASTSTS